MELGADFINIQTLYIIIAPFFKSYKSHNVREN